MTEDAVNYRRIPLELINEGKVDLIDELIADDFVDHSAPPGFPADKSGLVMFVTALRNAFPDHRYEVVGQWEDGDMHVGWIRATGTMTGDWGNMPASGKSATWDEVHIGRYANGQLAEHWAVIDQLGMLTQLGFIPPPGG